MEIEKAVDNSDAIAVCVSNTSIAKEGYVQREFRRVLDIALEKLGGTTFVIPVRLDDCLLPRQLRDRQSLDFFTHDQQDTVFAKLMASLNIRKAALGI